MKMSTGFFLLLLLMLCASSVRAQRRIDFISIDCGSPSKLYEDTDTNITYSPDGDYIDTGINQNISSEFMYPNNPNLPFPLSDLRSFPQGNKNCYVLKPEAGNGSLNLIRATFLYGNYDGENKLPEFDLYLGVNFWSTVRFENASDIVTKEIIGFAESNTVDICLINKGLGTPFISALEFRPLNSSTYGTEFGTSASLVLIERLDIGQGNGTGRYGDDVYDRIWSRHISPSWDPISTSSSITTYENGYRVPLEVIRTAATPQNASEPLNLYWNTTDMNARFYVFMYFAEVEKLEKNQSRKFKISWNGSPLFGPFTPRYLQADVISNSRALVGKDHEISLHKTEDSSLPPILNAVEVFQVMQLVESPTYGEDADAITNVKTTYQIKKIWAGDPCGPRNFSWEGLECNYSVSLPRIISLNLSSSNLNGIIAASIANLSSLESLDLSNNNLTGPVPQFLEELKSLTLLNLKGNQLSGSVPNALRERSEAGLLVLGVDTENLCGSGSCKKKKKIVAPIVASLVSALAVVIVLMLAWKLRRKRESGTEAEPFNKTAIASKKCQFTHEEVLDITKNLQTSIGKGGFGTVYHGCMKDGTQVVVKMLSASSTQGPREFQTEAELLMRIHHRNLASFIGYCDDANNLALIYEYMANGNLKNSLSDAERSSQMTWEMRLHIAIDAAQGLEYLHHGCKPPIVHRDVKTANILLSENLEAKIADFGLSKVFASDIETQVVSTVMGTAGYLDPEYHNCQGLNEKSDVYSFGVVLLELIIGQPAVIKSDEVIHIATRVSSELEKGELKCIVDQRMQGEFDEHSVWKTLEIAMACTTSTSQHRVAMDVVLSELKYCLEMESSRHRERTPRSTEELRTAFGPYNHSSPEVLSVYTDSTNVDSMTGPFAR
ncbi:probable LRR receptor-like serine/threonine-protein kinase At4g29180 isoform X1 [Pyrus x bretschneideri]|uniref:probable LRR receptor-like serine/threonine-protein kinase At4g29180 isoform X1 n=1 Tax=Pyrus x bretschneideri TaxID=225117 RepID=UPI002030B6D4|nr:probable LRR receptor-like serine/threonine-protein kinase At4g29180 isoform X1 [Pyrus x bretschneideri]